MNGKDTAGGPGGGVPITEGQTGTLPQHQVPLNPPTGPPIALVQLQPQSLSIQQHQPHFTVTSAGYPSIPPPQYGVDPGAVPAMAFSPATSTLPTSETVHQFCNTIL